MRWIDADGIKRQTMGLKDTFLMLMKKPKPSRVETFEEALQRLNLSEQDLIQRHKEFSFLAKFFITLSVMLCAYVIYLLTKRMWWSAVGTTGILLVTLSQWLRYNFWLFQIRQRRLGCRLQEWFADLRKAK